MIHSHHHWNTSYKPLIWGLVLSILLTLGAYFITVDTGLTTPGLSTFIILLACGQALVQLFFFMHLCIESNPKWNLLLFLFLVALMAVVIGGTIWIMRNLEYNTMPGM